MKVWRKYRDRPQNSLIVLPYRNILDVFFQNLFFRSLEENAKSLNLLLPFEVREKQHKNFEQAVCMSRQSKKGSVAPLQSQTNHKES